MIDITKLSIIDAIAQLRSGKLTSVQLVEACLANIERYNAEYNVLLTPVPADQLLHQARDIDETDYSLPLSGIPIAVKDMFSTAGLRTTAASMVLDNYIPVYDSTVVAKLKAAGAIIIGKANQDAWAHGATGENSQFGPTRNTYDTDRVAGGSSSGSAVAVAKGMCLAAIGTDTGGSIRLPASYNNLVGLKPTYGRVSRYGVIAMASSMDCMGHITRDVVDSAYLLNITAGQDSYDATTLPDKHADYLKGLDKKSLQDIVIGISDDFPTDRLDRPLLEKIVTAKEKLEKLGAKFVNVSLPNIKSAIETYYIVVPAEISSNLARYDGVRFGNGREKFGDEARRRI